MGVLPLMLLVLWMQASADIQRARAAGDARASADVGRLAQLCAARWSGTMQSVHLVQNTARVTSMALAAGSPDAAMSLSVLRASVDDSAGVLVDVTAVDLAGDVMWSTQPGLSSDTNWSARADVLAVLHDGQEAGVSRSVASELSGRSQIHFSAALRTRDGALVGATLVSVPSTIASTYAEAFAGQATGRVTIHRQDGALLASSSDQTGPLSWGVVQSLPTDNRQDGVVTSRRVRGGDGRVYFVAGAIDRQSQTFVAVAFDESEALAPTRAQVRGIWRQAEIQTALAALAMMCVLLIVRHRMLLAHERRHGVLMTHQMETLQRIGNNATDIVGYLDGDQRYVYVSPSVTAVLGLLPDQCIGRKIGWNTATGSIDQVIGVIAARDRGNAASRVTTAVRHVDGTLRWLESDIVALADPEDGHSVPTGYVVIGRDITRRLIDEENLRDVRGQLEDLISMSPGLLWRVIRDANGKLEVRMPVIAQERLFGHPNEAFLATDFLQVWGHPSDQGLAARALAEAFESGVATLELRLRKPEGAFMWCRAEYRRGRSGRQNDDVFVILTDIDLEREHRDAALHTLRLAALGMASTTILHDIVQPLATISVAVRNAQNIASRVAAEPAITDKLNLIAGQIDRLHKVVNHARQFGSAGHGTLEAVSVAAMLEELLPLAAARLDGAAVVAEVDVAAGLPAVLVDRIVLEQALLNIIVNACDQCAEMQRPPESRIIHISASIREGAVKISIVDHAGGIPEALHKAVFKPFFTTKSSGVGTGLGLSIASRAIQDLGGRMLVRNTTDGAAFDIFLPADGEMSVQPSFHLCRQPRVIPRTP